MQNSSDMEPKENADEEASLQDRFARLQTSFDQFSSELETVKENIKKRKRETTTVKILMYTGLLLLLVGFIYSNTTLQRVQLQNLEASFQTLQNQTNQELAIVERSFTNGLQALQTSLEGISPQQLRADRLKLKETLLQNVIARVKYTISQLEPISPQAAKLIEQFNRNSDELLLAYAQYKEEITQVKKDAELPASQASDEPPGEPAMNFQE